MPDDNLKDIEDLAKRIARGESDDAGESDDLKKFRRRVREIARSGNYELMLRAMEKLDIVLHAPRHVRSIGGTLQVSPRLDRWKARDLVKAFPDKFESIPTQKALIASFELLDELTQSSNAAGENYEPPLRLESERNRLWVKDHWEGLSASETSLFKVLIVDRPYKWTNLVRINPNAKMTKYRMRPILKNLIEFHSNLGYRIKPEFWPA